MYAVASILLGCLLGCTLEHSEHSSEYAMDIKKGPCFRWFPSAFSDHYGYYWTIYHIVVVGGVEPAYLTCKKDNTVTILPPGEPDPQQEVMHRLFVKFECLSLISHFSRESSMVNMKASLSRSPPRSFWALTLLTKVLPRNLRKTTGLWCILMNFPRTNGTASQLHLDLMLSSQSTVSYFLAYCRIDPPLMQPSCCRFQSRY